MPESKIERWYKGEQGKAYHHGKRALPENAVPWVARLRAEKIQKYVRETDCILEIGIGFGWNLAELRCAKRVGFDIENSLADSVMRSKITFVEKIEDMPSGSFDVILSHHMLEHVITPASTLQECHRLLRPGGTLLLFVPWEKERRYTSYNPEEPNHHLYSWNVQTLGTLVTESGFDVREAGVRKFSYDRFAAAWANKFCAGEIGFRLLRGFFLFLRPAYEVFVCATSRA
jgi:SAM-dependent methyltransferase